MKVILDSDQDWLLMEIRIYVRAMDKMQPEDSQNSAASTWRYNKRLGQLKMALTAWPHEKDDILCSMCARLRAISLIDHGLASKCARYVDAGEASDGVLPALA